jgi:hypothetical protein
MENTMQLQTSEKQASKELFDLLSKEPLNDIINDEKKKANIQKIFEEFPDLPQSKDLAETICGSGPNDLESARRFFSNLQEIGNNHKADLMPNCKIDRPASVAANNARLYYTEQKRENSFLPHKQPYTLDESNLPTLTFGMGDNAVQVNLKEENTAARLKQLESGQSLSFNREGKILEGDQTQQDPQCTVSRNKNGQLEICDDHSLSGTWVSTKTTPNQTLQVENQDKPRGTLTLDQLKDGAYRGTLTAEQQDQLKQQEEKEANLSDVNGDRQKSAKREPSRDKFRDEDVVKYMYEEWFLAGLSWCFNKTEDFLLNTIDKACDTTTNYCYKNATKAKGENPGNAQQADNNARLADALDRVGGFLQAAGNSRNTTQEAFDASKNNYRAIFDELKANLGKEEKDQQWTHFDPKDKDKDFIEKLQKDPHAAEQLDSLDQALAQKLDTMQNISRMAQAVTSIEMTEEFMQDKTSWKDKDTNALSEEHQKRSLKRQNQIMEACNTLAETTRLTAAAKYENLSEEDKKKLSPDGKTPIGKNAYVSQSINRDCNAFIDDLMQNCAKAQQQQNSNIKGGLFDVNGKKPDKTVQKAVKEIDRQVEQVVNQGASLSQNVQNEIQANTELGQKIQEGINLQDFQNAVISKERYTSSLKAEDARQVENLESKKAKNKGRKNALSQLKQRLKFGKSLNNNVYKNNANQR